MRFHLRQHSACDRAVRAPSVQSPVKSVQRNECYFPVNVKPQVTRTLLEISTNRNDFCTHLLGVCGSSTRKSHTKKTQNKTNKKTQQTVNRFIFVFHQLQRLKCFVKWIHIYRPHPFLHCPYVHSIMTDLVQRGKKKKKSGLSLGKNLTNQGKNPSSVRIPYSSEHGEVLILRKQHRVQRAPVRASGCTSVH